MKLPNVMTISQAIALAILSACIAIMLKLFGAIAISILVGVAVLSLAYAAIKKWAPEFIKPGK